MWALATQSHVEADIYLQALYYMYGVSAFRPAQEIARLAVKHYPHDLTLLLNSGVIELRMEDYSAASDLFGRYLKLGGEEETALDGLTTASFHLGDPGGATIWGSKAIDSKSARAARTFPPIPLGKAREDGTDIIAFSLWGRNPRYLRGALQNLIRARELYPDFTCRFLVDSSVPYDILSALASEGAQVVHCDPSESLLQRLARRFQVADDSSVRRYLIRDVDSVVGPREVAAVNDWFTSRLPFHVMRDWWTHTDPMLAGMWGGIGGVLPPLAPLIQQYQPEHAETAHIDQWFLRDVIWPSIRPRTFVHDRCFRTEKSHPFPLPDPGGEEHVGQNEFHADSDQQRRELQSFARSVPSLQL